MTNDRCPLHEEIEQCLAALSHAHAPVIEWIENGVHWLDQGRVTPRWLKKAERDCVRHLAALQDNKDVLRAMEVSYPEMASAFVDARGAIEVMTLRLQGMLKRIRAHEDIKPDQPSFVISAPINELSAVVEAYASLVAEQEQNFSFFNISADFMDAALLHAELDSIEDGCEECEAIATALEQRVLEWRVVATAGQAHLLAVCENLIQRLRFVQSSKRQIVAKLRGATADGAIAMKLKKLTDDTTDATSDAETKLN